MARIAVTLRFYSGGFDGVGDSLGRSESRYLESWRDMCGFWRVNGVVVRLLVLVSHAGGAWVPGVPGRVLG